MGLLDNVESEWLDEAEYFKEEQKSIDERVNRDFSKGAGIKTDDEKLYSKWLKHHHDETITPKELSDELFVCSLTMEQALYEISCTADYFEIEFEDAIIISDSQYIEYNQEGNADLDSRLNRWNLAKKVILNAWLITPSKLNDTVKTLLALNLAVPKELKKTIWVRENYAENQKKEALSNAFNSIFKSITHKPTVEIIVDTVIKSLK